MENIVNWKKRFRSYYYEGLPDPTDPVLYPKDTALLVIDIQNEFYALADGKWTYFHNRIKSMVIPNTNKVTKFFRNNSIPIFFARIACLTKNGDDRSLCQKKPGFNNILLYKDDERSFLVNSLDVDENDIQVLKTTDGVLSGTNLRQILSNMGIKTVVVTGIATDQCVSSTVRELSDASFNVIVLEDCCASAAQELHDVELTIINNIYCNVMTSLELFTYLKTNN